jgi:hypothetical protein
MANKQGLKRILVPSSIEILNARLEFSSRRSQPGIDDGNPFRLACASVGVIHFQKEDL